jgi:hypothetical protein
VTDHINAFNLVELRQGSIYDAGRLSEARAAWAMGLKCEHAGPAYHSGFFFGDEVKKHVAESIVMSEKRKPSLAGFRGKHWAPYFLLDIDNHEHATKPELAKDQADDVLRVLVEHLGVDPTMLLMCFSGHKGYHVYVPTACFDPEPCEDFGRRVRHMIEHGIWPHLNATIFPDPKTGVDWSLYDTLKVYRAINSRHEKGDRRWKIPLTLGLFHDRTFAETRDLAHGPSRDFPFPDWRNAKPSAELTALWEASTQWKDDVRKDFGERKVFDFSAIAGADPKSVPDRRLCAMKLGQSDVGHGNRNAAALMLISDMRERGLSPDEAMELMRKWLSMQKGTAKNRDYLVTQIRYVYDGGHASWGCFHPLAVANCFKQCMLFPQASEERVFAGEWRESSDLWQGLLDRAKQPVYYKLPFGELERTVRLRSKQANTLIGETGTGKTALSLEILRHNSFIIDEMRKRNPEFKAALGMFSLEMPGEELMERDGQYVTGQDQTWVEKALHRQLVALANGSQDQYYLDMVAASVANMRNVYFYDGAAVDLDRVRDLMQVGKAKYGINFFVIDFLDRIRSKGMNQYERIAPIAIGMKSIVRELDVQSLMLVQVARAASEQGLGLRSGRGSGQIEENSDVVLVYEHLSPEEMNKLQMPNDPSVKYLSLRAPKVRGGDPRGTAILAFDGATMTFKDVTPIRSAPR